MRYNCPEHGCIRASYRMQMEKRFGKPYIIKTPFCRYCNRLNNRAWRLTHMEQERQRARVNYEKLKRMAQVLVLFLFAGYTTAQTRVIVLPGEFDPGGASSSVAIANVMADAIGIWNAAAAPQTVLSYLVGPTTLIQRVAGCNQGWSGQAALNAQNAGLAWDRALFLQQYDNACRYGGEATLGGCCAYENSGLNPYVASHEIGHMVFAENHANAGFFDGVVGDLYHARKHEYGDPIDVMAGGDTVQAWTRYRHGWLVPQRIPRSVGSVMVHLERITQKQDAFVVQREDGNEIWGELRGAGQAQEAVYLRTLYNGQSLWVSTLLATSDEYVDAVGGVAVNYYGGGEVRIRQFPPTSVPPPDPTPAPWIDQPTPGPTPCFVGGIIRCTPTPVPTAAVPPSELSPTITIPLSATPTPPISFPPQTPTSTENVSESSPTPTMTETITPSASPTNPPVPSPTQTGGGGCHGKNASGSLGAGLIVGFAILIARRRTK